MENKRVLFVGSFKATSKDGSVGGQMFACKTIINSYISNSIDWTLIDSTSDSNILGTNYNRIKKAIVRMIKFMYYIVFFKYDYVLIFMGDGWSIWEKGLMSVLAKFFTKSKVIIAPRSGFILRDLSRKGKISKFIKFVFNKIDIVICQSNLWKILFEDFSGQRNDFKFRIIENIIDFDKYEKLPVTNVKENEKVTILFMAWVTKNKGIFELIKAAKMLKEESLNFHLIIAGKGEDYISVTDEIQNLGLFGCVTLKGWVLGEQKLELLSHADIFVLPTYYEGYPNSLMEAMASGKACIASRVGSIPDMIKNMENGILIDKENHFQLYQGLKILIEYPELRRKMSLEAREHVRKTNTMQIGISKFQKILSQ